MLTPLIIMETLLFLLLLISLPIRVSVQAKLSLRMGRAWVCIKLFGFVKIPITFKIHIFSEPYFTLFWLRKHKAPKEFLLLKQKKDSAPKKPTFVPDITIDKLNVCYTLGIENDAAATVWVLGGLQLLSETAGNALKLPLRVSLCPVFDCEVFRINLDGMITVRLVNSIGNYLKKRKERRSTHASG